MLWVFASIAVASPVFGKPMETPPTPPTPFVEGSAPEGKALIYIYRAANNTFGMTPTGVLILAQNGPIGVLGTGNYFAYVVEPGNIKLWLASIYSKEVTVETVAGQIYYVSAGFGMSLFGPIPTVFFDLKKREDGINEMAGCKQVTE
jgi:hypothetical protein